MEKTIEGIKGLGVWEKVTLAAGAVLFVAGFLPWYSISIGSVSFSRNGWQSPGAMWSVLPILIGMALAAAVVVRKISDATVPQEIGGVSWAKIHFGAGTAALVCVAIKFLNESSYLGFGFYLGLLAAAALALAGFWMYREENGRQPPLQPL